jgi:hypothetical protein
VYNSCFSYISQNTFRSFINTYFQRKLRTHLDFQVRIVFGCVLNTFSTVYPGTKRFALSTQDINLRTGRVLRKWDETSINLMEVLRDDPHVLQLKGRTTYSRTADGSRFCVLLYEEPVPEAMHYLRGSNAIPFVNAFWVRCFKMSCTMESRLWKGAIVLE